MKRRRRPAKDAHPTFKGASISQISGPQTISEETIKQLRRAVERATAEHRRKGIAIPDEDVLVRFDKNRVDFRFRRDTFIEQVSFDVQDIESAFGRSSPTARLGQALGRLYVLAKAATTARSGPQTSHRATWILDLLSMCVPKRLASEEIGDALERINAMLAAGRPSWFIYLKVATTTWWVAWHSVLHYAERIAGIIGKATGGKGE
ncbi:hypothetical protein [Myxococcus sp. Y35]|uniref:hypothetical protein n=1 Tax=Pseudomyxococcus flavus TaxID=3115648 RepID=UPI003CF41424